MRIVVIGCGVMGGALARHFAKNHQVILVDKDLQKAELLSKEIGAEAASDRLDRVKEAEAVLLAVKPKDLPSVASLLSPYLSKEKIVLSVLAGIPLSILAKHLPSCSLVRVMPNLALTVGQGVIGFAETGELSKEKREEMAALFQGLGLLLWLPDQKMEALTALSASSPAFIYVIIEAMIEAGVEAGFASHEAREIVLQTIEGSVSLLRQSHKHPAELKLQIASPAGTTIAGLKEMEVSGVRAGIWKAVLAAYRRGLDMLHEIN